MSLLDNLPHTCTAKRRTRTHDSLGGAVDAYTTLFADRACFRQPLSVREVQWWQQTHEVAITHKLYFASDPGLGVEDVVVVGGELFEVMQSASPDASVGLGLLWRVHVNQLSGAQL